MSKTIVAVVAAVALVAGGLLWANAPIQRLTAGAQADRVVVDKAARRLSLYSHGVLIGSYAVALGRSPVGAKERNGDHRTPEGLYVIDRHNPHSAFHLALHVSYPSSDDFARAQAAGYSPGSDIMVHGMRNGLGWIGRAHLLLDWTSGCVAVTNAEIEQLYSAIPDGTPIEFRP